MSRDLNRKASPRLPRVIGFAIQITRVLALALLAAIAFTPAAHAQASTTQFLFVAQQVAGTSGQVQGIVTYTVDSATGSLTPITATPVQPRAAEIVGGLAINSASTFLFASSENSAQQGAVSVFAIAADGSLTELDASPFAISTSQGQPAAIAMSPNGQFLYVASAVVLPYPAASYSILDELAIAADRSLTLRTRSP